MSRFSEQNAFSLWIFFRSLFYIAGLVGVLWVFGIWTWKPKPYLCYSGFATRFQKVEIIDWRSFQLYAWSVDRVCAGGAADEYNPQVYRSRR